MTHEASNLPKMRPASFGLAIEAAGGMLAQMVGAVYSASGINSKGSAMSYKQAMKWNRKHPKGTRQPVIMHTESGFWPARSWIVENWLPYAEACALVGVEPFEQQTYYNCTLRGCVMASMDFDQQARYTRKAIK